MLSTAHDLDLSNAMHEVNSRTMDTFCDLDSYRCGNDVYLGLFDWDGLYKHYPAVINFCMSSLLSDAWSSEMSVRDMTFKESSEELGLVSFARKRYSLAMLCNYQTNHNMTEDVFPSVSQDLSQQLLIMDDTKPSWSDSSAECNPMPHNREREKGLHRKADRGKLPVYAQ